MRKKRALMVLLQRSLPCPSPACGCAGRGALKNTTTRMRRPWFRRPTFPVARMSAVTCRWTQAVIAPPGLSVPDRILLCIASAKELRRGPDICEGFGRKSGTLLININVCPTACVTVTVLGDGCQVWWFRPNVSLSSLRSGPPLHERKLAAEDVLRFCQLTAALASSAGEFSQNQTDI
jgi:hypothetical protein